MSDGTTPTDTHSSIEAIVATGFRSLCITRNPQHDGSRFAWSLSNMRHVDTASIDKDDAGTVNIGHHDSGDALHIYVYGATLDEAMAEMEQLATKYGAALAGQETS